MSREDLELAAHVGRALALMPPDEILSEIHANNNANLVGGLGLQSLGLMSVTIETFAKLSGGGWVARTYEVVGGPELVKISEHPVA